jgi:hypothetical protein
VTAELSIRSWVEEQIIPTSELSCISSFNNVSWRGKIETMIDETACGHLVS